MYVQEARPEGMDVARAAYRGGRMKTETTKAALATLETKQIEDLLYQALETELGGVEIYRQALLCARNADLKAEWQKYLAQTQRHVEILRGVFEVLDLDPE